MTGPSRHMPPPAPAASAFVRPYVVTGGRTRGRHLLSPDTVLEAGQGRPRAGLAAGEYQQITSLCRQRPRSVAELAGTLRQPLAATRVLISDLIDARVLELPVSDTDAYIPASSPDDPLGDRPSRQLLEKLRVGLYRRMAS